MNKTCEVCQDSPAIYTAKGPMIWYEDGKGLYRPEKCVCETCARLPTDELWPMKHPRDSRQPRPAIRAEVEGAK